MTLEALDWEIAQRGGADALVPPEQPLFVVVPVADLAHIEPEPPSYWWDGYLPAGVVTLLGAHGGTGKSTLGLMLGVCIAQELPLFGVATRRGRVAFFSGEDGAGLMRYRLHWICCKMGVNLADLDGLHILDATEGEPTLFHEVGAAGRRQGITTPSYDALRRYVEEHDIDVLIVDNASDAFDASEIDRAKVRGFMRALASIVQARAGAVLLLAHVDKGTSRGERSGTESYSGSTAWHNSARSRLYLTRDKDGGLLLEHQKANLGSMREPLRLAWPQGGIPQVDVPMNGFVQHIADGVNTKAVLKMIHEFTERGEHIGAATTSRAHAGKLLRGQPGFPAKLQDRELFDLLRAAERRSLIERVSVRSKGRGHSVETWQVTARGLKTAGIAPTAPTCADFEVGALAEGAPTAPTSVRGVWGEMADAEVGAEPGGDADAPNSADAEVGAEHVAPRPPCATGSGGDGHG